LPIAGVALLALVAGACSSKDSGSDTTASDAANGDAAAADQLAYNCDQAEKNQPDAVAKAVALAADCSLASDCTLTTIKTGCGGTCGNFIAKNQEGAFATAMAAIDQTLCKESGYKAHCNMHIPGCAKLAVACVGGKCKPQQ